MRQTLKFIILSAVYFFVGKIVFGFGLFYSIIGSILIAQYGLLSELSKKTGEIIYRQLAVLGLVLAIILFAYVIFAAFFLLG